MNIESIVSTMMITKYEHIPQTYKIEGYTHSTNPESRLPNPEKSQIRKMDEQQTQICVSI